MKNDYLKTYDEEWKEYVENPDGSLDKDKVARELADFSFIMAQVRKVYCHITGDRLSKPNYYAETVIQQADEETDRIAKMYMQDMLTSADEEALAKELLGAYFEEQPKFNDES